MSIRRRDDGQASDFEVPTDVGAAEVAAQLAQALGEPAGSAPLELRIAGLGRSLRPDETFAQAGVFDGATLILARANDPLERVTSLAVPDGRTDGMLVPLPPPPALALPPEDVRARSPWPFVALGVLLLAVIGLGVWFVRSRDEPATTSTPVAPAPAPTLESEVTVSPPTAAPTLAPTLAPTSAATLASAQPRPDEDAAWGALLAQLDSVWGVDWPASIGLLQAFHSQYPTRASATDKLYAALIEYGRALREAGALSAASDQFDQAVRLAPQRFEAREELAALMPAPTEVATPARSSGGDRS